MEYIALPAISADFVLRVAGNSMAPVFLDNDLVLCIDADAVPDGSVAVVQVDGRATIKRVFYTAQGYMFESDSCEFPPLFCNQEEVKIIGRPVGLERAFT